ncbi:MAG: DUF2480 family protein [Microscillaceae bacterium]|nr:DUF2480 family protein [Microscillaceae bacterium]
MKEEIINRVALSPLISLDLADFYPEGERLVYDLKDNLYQGMILREKDFRDFAKSHDWSQYAGKNVAIICSAEAIVPTWAYMLLAVHLRPFARYFVFGDLAALEQALFQEKIGQIDPEMYRGKKIVVKGCGDLPIPAFAYVALTQKLLPVVASLMYGEPCSTVPLYKRPKG